MVEISELICVEINQKDISVAHRLPAKKARDKSEKPDSLAIIARLVNRSVRTENTVITSLIKQSANQNFP